MNPRLIFAGTGRFAVPALHALAAQGWIVKVVTQPDRPAGRGLETCPSDVSLEAAALDLPVIKPRSINAPTMLEELEGDDPDLLVVADFGQLLKRKVLDLPALGCINIHGSLLPRWRGAAPVAWAVMSGDQETGVTTMFVDEGMDTGPILLQEATPIGDDETAQEVEDRLARIGGELAVATVTGVIDRTLSPTPQPAEGTLAPKLTREHGRIDWHANAQTIHNLVRGTQPWPGAWTHLQERRVKVLRSRVAGATRENVPPGTILPHKGGLWVTTADGVLELVTVQPEGCRPMSGQAFRSGHCRRESVRLGTCSS